VRSPFGTIHHVRRCDAACALSDRLLAAPSSIPPDPRNSLVRVTAEELPWGRRTTGLCELTATCQNVSQSHCCSAARLFASSGRRPRY
jgi:hypothetical protein